MAYGIGIAQLISFAFLTSQPPLNWPVSEDGRATGLSQEERIEISLVGDFVGDFGHREESRRQFDFRELEVLFATEINSQLHFAGSLSVANEEGDVESGIEELYGEYTGLGRAVSVRFGKIAAAIGRVQRKHGHELNALNLPLALQDTLGDEGLREPGLSASYRIASHTLQEVSLDFLSISEDKPLLQKTDGKHLAYVARYRTLISGSDDFKGEIGLTYLNGPTHPTFKKTVGRGPTGSERKRGDMYGLDVSFKLPRVRAASEIEMEAYWSRPEGTLRRTFGAFGRAYFEVHPRWFATIGYDYSELPGSQELRRGWLGGVTYKLSGFNHWRLEFQRIESTFERDRNALKLQMQWHIGTHHSHDD